MHHIYSENPEEDLIKELAVSGLSGLEGVGLTGVTLTFSARTNLAADEDSEIDAFDYVEAIKSETKWARAAAAVRWSKDPDDWVFKVAGSRIQLLPSGGTLNLLAFIPSVEIDFFGMGALAYQKILQDSCKLVGLEEGEITLVFGMVTIPWHSLQEKGYAEERLVEY